jgi:hypothetical protein
MAKTCVPVVAVKTCVEFENGDEFCRYRDSDERVRAILRAGSANLNKTISGVSA